MATTAPRTTKKRKGIDREKAIAIIKENAKAPMPARKYIKKALSRS